MVYLLAMDVPDFLKGPLEGAGNTFAKPNRREVAPSIKRTGINVEHAD